MNFPKFILPIIIILHCQFFVESTEVLSLTKAQRLIDLLAHNYEEKSAETGKMKDELLKTFGAKKSHHLQDFLQSSLEILDEMGGILGPIQEEMKKFSLSEDEKFHFILSQVYPFGRLLVIKFLRNEDKTMELLAEHQKRWDIVKYMEKLEIFNKNSVKLLKWLQMDTKFKGQSHLWNIHAIQKEINDFSVTFKSAEEKWETWYTVDKKKKEFEPILLINGEATELFQIFNSKKFDNLKESNEAEAFKNYFHKNSLKNNESMKAVEFVLEKTTAAIEEINLVLLKSSKENEISAEPGQGLLTYQEQNIVFLAVFYKFALGLLEQMLPKKVAAQKSNANIKIPSTKTKGRRRKRFAVPVDKQIHQIQNLRETKRKLTTKGEIHELKVNAGFGSYQLEFENFKMLREEIGKITNFKGSVECLDSMDYSTYFKVVHNGLVRFTTHAIRNFKKGRT